MENLSAIAIITSSTFSNVINFQTSTQSKPSSAPTKEKIEQLNKLGHEYPFCVFHKYKKNDPL
jgi:hypothetical protein